MFNLFGKKKQEGFGLKNMEEYTPAYLPKNVEDGHTDLSTFIVGDYSMLDEKFLAGIYVKVKEYFEPLVNISDVFTPGNTGDPFISTQLKFARDKHEEEVAMHELSAKNIVKAREVRKQELEERIPKLKDTIVKRQQKIDSLSDKHANHAIRIGKTIIQLGLPVTALAFVADFFVNTEFVQSILYSNVNMLRILVVCLCLMSDGTMYALGSMVSKKTDTKTTAMYRAFFAAFVFLFSVSVIGSIAIRVGSMPTIYGTFDAKGNWISKESFTIAEYALAIISSLATAVTGLLSFFFSVDKDYYLEKERMKLKTEQENDEKLCIQLEAELASLEQAVDPMICDRERRNAAEANLEALRIGLMMFMRKLLALHQQDASYLDSMSESAKNLLEDMQVVVSETVVSDETQTNMKTRKFHEAGEYKEAV